MFNRLPHFSLAISALVLGLISCTSGPEGEGDTPPAPQVQFTDEQLTPIGNGIAKEMNAGNAVLFDSTLSLEALFRRIVWPHEITDEELGQFLQGYEEEVGSRGATLGQELARQFRTSGAIYFVHVLRGEDGVKLLYRFSAPTGGLNYIEFLVDKSADGKPVLADMYSSMTGEHLSAILRRGYISQKNGPLGKLINAIKKDASLNEMVEAVKKMQSMIQEGNFKEVLTYFDGLPENVRKQKSVQIMRVQAAMKLNNDDQYLAVIEDVLALYPNDAGLELMQIDYYFLQKKYDSVFAVIDRLDNHVHDPYLNYNRALVYLSSEDYKRADEFAEGLIRWDSTLIEPYYVLMTGAKKRKDHPALAAILERMQKSGTGKIEFANIESDADLRDFAASKEYVALKKTYQ